MKLLAFLFLLSVNILFGGVEILNGKKYLIKEGKVSIEATSFTMFYEDEVIGKTYSISIHDRVMKNIENIKKFSIVKDGNISINKEAFVFMDASCLKCQKNIDEFSSKKEYSKVYFVISDKHKTMRANDIYVKNGAIFNRKIVDLIYSNIGIRKVPLVLIYENDLIYINKFKG